MFVRWKGYFDYNSDYSWLIPPFLQQCGLVNRKTSRSLGIRVGEFCPSYYGLRKKKNSED
jgi:hypothetical protein